MQDGRYLDSCIVLGTNSSYSASEYDQIYFDGGDESHRPDSNEPNTDSIASQNTTELYGVYCWLQVTDCLVETTTYTGS